MMNQEWTIHGRAHQCAVSGAQFTEGEFFYTLLFDDKTGYRREDLSEEAWKTRPAEAPAPFSFWRTKYTPPPPPEATVRRPQRRDLDALLRQQRQPGAIRAHRQEHRHVGGEHRAVGQHVVQHGE